MNRIETQSVEMTFGEPIKRVIDEELAHSAAFRAIEVDAVSPWSLVSISKELGCVRT
jgi:hypothetical protein